MQQNSNKDFRQLYRISSAGTEFQFDHSDPLLNKCYHIDSGREYATKTLEKNSKSVVFSRQVISDLLELDHPNIMQIYDFYEGEDFIQIIFQKCEGTTLFRGLKSLPGCKADERTSSHLISQILSSAKYLHRRNFVFRELSVDNILILENSFGYDLKITEFSLQVSTPSKKSYLQGIQDVKYDLFSIGIVAFSLVTGIRPVIEKGKEEYVLLTLGNHEEFQRLSNDCKSFILECLTSLSVSSTNTTTLLRHPWLVKYNAINVTDPILPDTLLKMRAYQKKPLIGRILTLAVSHSLNMTQLENIRREFQKFDTKCHGEISYNNFKNPFEDISEEEIKQIFSAINFSHSHTISYHEFICALMTDKIVSEKNMKSTFLQLCCCNQEYLIKTDLWRFFSNDCSMEYIVNMFKDAGLSADSFLSYNQFKKLTGFHYHVRRLKTITASPGNSSTDSPHSVTGIMEMHIPPMITSSNAMMVHEEIVARRRLQSLTENMVIENSQTDVNSIYAVDSGDILGTGVCGHVFRCRHRVNGTRYAIKSIDITNKSKSKINALRQEIRMMAKLDHPNILRLHETFENNTTISMILDLCSGGELFDGLNDRPNHCYPENVTCKHIYDILGAIRYCHDHGITHRDLKLENLLFESSAENACIKLIDFGLSCYFDHSHYLTECIGTPYYVAPEVLAKQYNEKADIWSIGVIAYMLMTGTPLFDGEDDNEIIHAVAKGDIVYCSRFKNISPAGQHFINSCLIRNPVDRLSAQEAQNHIWFQSLQRNSQTISSQIFNNLHKFLTRQPLSRLFMLALAHTQQQEEYLGGVRQAFTAINTSKSGEINYDELRSALLEKFNFQNINAIYSMLDMEHTGKISYHQFVSATINLSEIQEKAYKMAFYKISNHQETFTLTDVESLLGKIATVKEMEILLLDWNRFGLSSITFDNFKNIINDTYDIQSKTKSTTTSTSTSNPSTATFYKAKSKSYDSQDYSNTSNMIMTHPPPAYLKSSPSSPHFKGKKIRDISPQILASTPAVSLPPIVEQNDLNANDTIYQLSDVTNLITKKTTTTTTTNLNISSINSKNTTCIHTTSKQTNELYLKSPSEIKPSFRTNIYKLSDYNSSESSVNVSPKKITSKKNHFTPSVATFSFKPTDEESSSLPLIKSPRKGLTKK